jgi:glycosidase
MKHPTYPSLYQINTRVFLGDLSRRLGRRATLKDVPDDELDGLANIGFDWVWFLGVWQTGPAGREVSLRNPEWRREYQQLLPDFQEEDVCGSCFAIMNWSVHTDFGGNSELASLRDRIHARGMKLMLDFVPNHTAPDHAWVHQHPEFYVHGTEEQLGRETHNYIRVQTVDGPAVLAFGRDPYFPGWPDTLQLNYAEPALRDAMASELENIAGLCDGVRCDMAMLILPEVFERTWGQRPEPFWPMAIPRVRSRYPDFVFMAEVYWDLEWTLQQQGFNYTYDKRLYDRLLGGPARPVRDHLRADMDFQKRSARFLENHDEPRAASVFTPEKHKAAAVLTFLCPGLRFIHQGQVEGRTKRIPVHLGRGPVEPTDTDLSNFYERLLACVHRPEIRDGEWQLLEGLQAWEDNWTSDCFISFAWSLEGRPRVLVVVNYAPHRSQCYMRIPWSELGGWSLRLKDLMGTEVYERNGLEVLTKGLYLDLPAWGFNVFEVATGH